MSRKLGNYRVLEEVGRGGMAVVYRARQESLDRIVAIKELDLKRTTSDLRAAERFKLEAKAAASLDHPNIITVHDFWERSKKAYIAMEFVDGLELKEVLDQHGAIGSELAALIGIQICKALSYAHERGIVHRDVKPGNIMLSARGDVKLADFGIVFVSGSADLTTTGQVIGTPSYMSPEQIRGEDLGPASDIFSLGVVLYEAVTGSKPFTAPNDAALTHAIMRKRPIRPRRLNRRIPRQLSRVIMKCLRKKPHKRYLTMDDLTYALRKALPRKPMSTAEGVSRLVAEGRQSGKTDATMPLKIEIKPNRLSRFVFLAIVVLAFAALFLLAFLTRSLRDPGGPVSPVPAGKASLSVVAYPWAEVILDGRKLGFTPSALPYEVEPGRHRLVVKNPHLGSRTLELDLKEGKPTHISVDFLEDKK
ncbi:serine/threonine protein kinase [bacterium]|nr:MAG: serine/threonine protein kinase [bacterium]